MIELAILITSANDGLTDYKILVLAPEATSWSAKHLLDGTTVEQEVQGLRRALSRVIRQRRSVDSMKSQGQFVFDVLFPSDIKQLLRLHQGSIKISCSEWEVPWHLLHDGQHFLGERWCIGSMQEKPNLGLTISNQTAEARALVVADPACDLSAARFEGEAVLAALSQASLETQGEVRFGPVRKREFIKAFKGQRILHFAGHFDSNEDGVLGWRFADGHVGPADFSALRGGASPELFFSNACQAARAADFSMLVDVGVQNYIAPILDVPDLASADFSRRFYDELCKGETVGNALRKATWDGVVDGDNVGLSYRLFGSPERQYFRRRDDASRGSSIRRCCFVYVRLVDTKKSEMNAALRSFAQTVVDRHGGQMLPGKGAVVRVAFGLNATREDDRLRALNGAFEIYRQMMGVSVLVCDGQVTTDGDDAEGDVLLEMESVLWQLETGVFGGGSVPQWGINLCRSVPSGVPAFPKLERLVNRKTMQSSVLVGRKNEFERMREQSRQCLEKRHSRLLLISGAAGIGKTKIVFALVNSQPHAYSYVYVDTTSYQRQSLWQVLSGITAQVLFPDDPSDLGTKGTELLRRIRELDDGAEELEMSVDLLSIDDLLSEPVVSVDLEQYYRIYAALLGIEVPKVPPSADQITQAVSVLIKKSAQNMPICLIVEGLGRLNESTCLALDSFINTLHRSPILVIKTSRTDQVLLADWQGDVVPLGPLSKSEAKLMLNQSELRLSGKAVSDLVKRAQGNPLFLSQLAHSIGSGQMAAMPASIEILFSARLDALPELEQRCLRIASVIGRPFSPDEIATLSTQVVNPIAALERLVDSNCLAKTTDSRFVFSHPLFSEVVYQTIAPAQAQVWHGRLALALVESTKDATTESLLSVGRHFLLSGDDARGELYALKAADKAARQGDFLFAMGALELVPFERCSRYPESEVGASRYLEILGRAQLLMGLLEQSKENLFKALSLSTPGTPLWSRCTRFYAETLSGLGQGMASLEVLSSATSVLSAQESVDRPGLTDLLLMKAWEEYKQRFVEDSIKTIESAREFCDEADDVQMGIIDNFFGVVALFKGEHNDAETHLKNSLARHRRSADLKLVARSANNLGILFHRLGKFRRSVTYFEQVIRCHQACGDRLSLALVYNNLGSLYGDMGNYLKAERFFRETIRIRREAKHSGLALALTNLASVLYHQASFAKARATLDEASEVLPDGNLPSFMESGFLRYDGLLCLEEGQLEEAERKINRSVEAAKQFGNDVQVFEATVGLAVLYLKRDELDRATAAFTSAVALLDISVHTLLVGRYFQEWAEAIRPLEPEQSDSYRAWAVALTAGGEE